MFIGNSDSNTYLVKISKSLGMEDLPLANHVDEANLKMILGWIMTFVVLIVLPKLYKMYSAVKRRADMIMALPGPTYSNRWLCDLTEMAKLPPVPAKPQHQDLWSYFVRMCKEYQSYGAVRLVIFSPYRLPFLSQSVVFLTDADLVRACIKHPACQSKGLSYEVSKPMIDDSVLIAHGTDPTWKRQRKLTSRAFSNEVMERMTDRTAWLLYNVVYPKFLDSRQKSNETVDFLDLMSRFALDVLGDVAFSKSFGGLVTAEEEAAAGKDMTLYKVFDEIMVEIDQQGRTGGLYKILPIRWDVFSNLKKLNRVIDDLIDERIASKGSPQNDLMSTLLQKDEAGNFILSRKELLGNARTFLFAGHETTSSTLVMAVYELSKHPEIVSRRENKPRNPTYSDLRSLPLLDKVIRETLRLYSPAMFGRTGKDDFVLETAKYRLEIPKGTELVMSPWIVQRMALDDGEEWKPDRWDADATGKSNYDTGAYFPFAIGARNCVGRELGLAEVRAVLAHLVHDFDFVPPKDDVVTYTRMTLNPNQCNMKFIRRSSKDAN